MTKTLLDQKVFVNNFHIVLKCSIGYLCCGRLGGGLSLCLKNTLCTLEFACVVPGLCSLHAPQRALQSPLGDAASTALRSFACLCTGFALHGSPVKWGSLAEEMTLKVSFLESFTF